MAALRNLSLAVFTAAVLIAVLAQDVDTAEEGCILTETECTCAQSASTGDCTRPTAGGKCLQGDCTPSHKCDCFGYELCAITTCGKWTPAVNAILSRSGEFQCSYEAEGSKCRTVTKIADTMEAAENAKTASVKYVEDIVGNEMDIAEEVTETLILKAKALDALRAVQLRADDVPEAELQEVADLAQATMVEAENVVKELGEASAAAKNSFAAMEKARIWRTKAKNKRDQARAMGAAVKKARADAAAKGEPCVTCDDMKAEASKLYAEVKEAVLKAGTWATRGRDNQTLANEKKTSAQKRKEKVEATTTMCTDRSQSILDRLSTR